MDDALALAADAPELIRILTHPITGMVLTVDTYRPSKKLKRFLRLRDGRCRFPVCNRPPPKNRDRPHLRLGLRRQNHTRQPRMPVRGEHLLKHNTAWKVRQISPGVLEWTSPLGQIITDQPDTDIPGATAPF